MRDNHKKEKRGMDQRDDAGADGIIGQDTDRRTAEDALSEAEQRYRAIFENAGEGIFQTTPQGRYIGANPALARMHGFDSPEELISSLRDISRQVYVDPARREEFKKLLEERGVVRGFEHQIFRKDGSKIWVALNARAVRDARGAILYYEGTTQDINERKRAEARSAAFATLARKLSGARTPLDAARIIVQTARDLFGWDSCDLNHYDADRDLVYQMLNIDIIDGRQTEVFGVISGRKPTARGRRIIDHGPELLLREEPVQFDEDAIPFGDRTRPSASIMTVPIRHAHRVIGLLSIQSYTPHSYDSAALDNLQALADHCGEALNRIRAEQALVESEERFRQMVDQFEDVLWITDSGIRKALYVNPAYEKVFGRSIESVTERVDSFVEVVHPDDRDAVQGMLARQREGAHEALEYRIVQPGGSVRWLLRRSFPIRNNQGEVYRVAGIAQDITERKRAEQALRASEERYRKVVENFPNGVVITCDKDLRVTFIGGRGLEEGGFSPDFFVGKSLGEIAPPEVVAIAEPHFRAAFAGRTESYECPYPDGRAYFAAVAPLVNGRGLIDEILVISQDITERKRAQEELQESEERFRQLAEAPFEAIILYDNGTILEVNQPFCRMYGYERAEVIGKSVLDLTPPEFREPLLQRVRSEGTGAFEGLALRKDGTIFRAELAAKPIHYQGRGVRVAAIRDVTEQKRNERRQAAQYAVTRVLAESATLAEATPQLLRAICESLRWKMGEFWRLGDNPNFLRCGETWHIPGLEVTSFIEASRHTELAPGDGLPGRVWQSGQPAWIPDVMTDPRFARAAIAAKLGLRGAVAFPILLGNQTLGVMLFFSRRAPEVDEELLKIMSAIGSQIGQFTERKRAEEKVQSLARFPSENPNPVLRLGRDGMILYANSASRLLLQDWGCAVGDRAPLFWQQEASAALASQTNKTSDVVCGDITFSIFVAPIVEADYVNLYGSDITERKRAEEALRQSEVYFRSLIEHAADTISTYDANGVRLYTSPSIERVLGYKPEEMIGLSGFELLHPDDRPFLSSLFAQAVQIPGTTITKELRCRHKDGTWRTLESTGSNLLGNPEVGAVVLNSRDITERRRAEEALRESEERFRDLVENSRELICTHDLDGLVLSANPAAAAAIGYDLDELVAKKTIRDLLAPGVSDQFDQYMARLRKEGTTSGSMLVQTRSGERRVWAYYNSLRTEGVAAPIVRGMARDITDRKRAEESARRYRERLEALIHSVDGIVWEADARTFKFTFVSAQAERMLGFPCEQWINEPSFWRDHIHPDDRDQAIRCCLESTARKLPHEFEYRMIARDGRSVWLRDLVTIQVEDDHPVTLRGVMLDITERKQAEEALRESEERYRELFENAKDAIYVHDLSGRYTSVNRAAEQLSGFSRQEILGKHFSNFVSPRDLRHVRINLCRKLDEENETIYQVDVVTRTGQRVPVEISSRLIYEKDVVVGVQGTARDITDRKRAQEALRIYSQRLIEAQEAERQRIARELHDEIGQVLTAVRINLQSIQRSRGTDESVRPLDESIAIVDEALGRVRELSIELRPSLLDDLGLSAALRWYVDRYAQRTGIIAEVLDGFKEDGRLPRDLETACFRIAQEALTNVARHAQAGSVSVQLERSRERMLLTVIDDGVGFDIDKLRKSASTASALGLRGMEERALALGGCLEIDSGAQRGTRILATFPLKRK